MNKLLVALLGIFLFSSCTEIKLLQNGLVGLGERVQELEMSREMGLIDQDQDGVLDALDQDVNSAPNAAVTSRGVYADTDRDNVPDYKDQEPLTPAGNEVDENGVSVGGSASGSAAVGAPIPSIYFEEGSAALGFSELTKLADVARYMAANPRATVTVIGHANQHGSKEYNQNLSEERAQAVKSCLTKEFFIAEDRIRVQALGETSLLSSISAINRRVDVSVK